MNEETVMKKWIVTFVALLLLSCSVTAFAEESHTGVPGKQGIEVHGSCISSKNYYEITVGIAGVDTVELPGGVTLTGRSDSRNDNGLRIIIIPVTAEEETEAYAWMADAAANLGKEPTAYYLAFRRGNTPEQPEGKITVTIAQKGGYAKTKLYYMDGNAKAKEIADKAQQDNSSFAMEQSGYYIRVKAAQHPIDPGEVTGDNMSIWLYLVLMGAGAAVLLSLLIKARKNGTI